MTLINKPEVGRQDGEILLSVGQTFECDREPNSIPKLGQRHPGGPRKDAADVKARVTHSLGYIPKIRSRRVCDDRFASMLDDAPMVCSGCRAVGGEAPRDSAFRKDSDEFREPLVELETINALP
jgi:hypothetical protein